MGWLCTNFLPGFYNRVFETKNPFSKKLAAAMASQIYAIFRTLLSTHEILAADIVYVVKRPNWFFLSYIKLLKKPWVYDFDDPVWQTNMLGMKQFQKLLSSADGFTCDNEIQLTQGLRFNPLGIIAPGATPKRSSQRTPLSSKRTTFLWVGSVSTTFYVEDIYPAITAVAQSRPQSEFILAGWGKMTSGNHPTNVSFVESYDAASLLELLSKAHFGLFPLRDDELGIARGIHKANVYLDAGKPVIAFKNANTIARVDHGVNGFLYSNLDELERILLDCIDSPQNYLRLIDDLARQENVRALKSVAPEKLLHDFFQLVLKTKSQS